MSTFGQESWMCEMLRISFSSSNCCCCCWCCRPMDKLSWELRVSCDNIVVDGGRRRDGSSSGCILDDPFFVGVFLGEDFVLRVIFALCGGSGAIRREFYRVLEMLTYSSMTFISIWWYFWYSSSPNSAGSCLAASYASQNWWINFWFVPFGFM